MKAAVYSAGPSIAKTWRGGYGIGICVNGASLIVPRGNWQWLCCGDLDCFDEMSPYPTPSVGCFAFLPGGGPIGPRFAAKQWLCPSDIPWLAGGARPSYTISTALALAHALGATSIDLYGHDQEEGVTNCENKSDPLYVYTEARANRESCELRQVQTYLARHHVTVTRK